MEGIAFLSFIAETERLAWLFENDRVLQSCSGGVVFACIYIQALQHYTLYVRMYTYIQCMYVYSVCMCTVYVCIKDKGCLYKAIESCYMGLWTLLQHPLQPISSNNSPFLCLYVLHFLLVRINYYRQSADILFTVDVSSSLSSALTYGAVHSGWRESLSQPTLMTFGLVSLVVCQLVSPFVPP